MLLDNNLLVSNAQTVTGTNTSVVSTNTVDLGTNREIGAGAEYPTLQAVIGTAFAGATSVEIQAIQADDAALSSGVKVIGSSGPIPLASLTAAARFEVNLNTQIGSKGQRYLGARYVIVGAGSAGVITSFFGLDTQDGQKFYPSGYTVA